MPADSDSVGLDSTDITAVPDPTAVGTNGSTAVNGSFAASDAAESGRADGSSRESRSKKDKRSGSKTDGRKRRWQEHKVARREELVDGTIAAIRVRGRDAGMDEIAAEIGVSKTVLYRYFADKNDLTTATMLRYVQTILAPRIYAAVSEDTTEYELTRETITAYVHTVAEDPELYLYVMSNTGSASGSSIVADSERMIAEVVSTVLGQRLRDLGMDSGGSLPWAYGIVGAIRLATHWWISNRAMSAEDLIDYLTMMAWGGMTGIAGAHGSPARFRGQDHTLSGAEHDESAGHDATAPRDDTAGN